MTPFFADTYFFLASVNPNDPAHKPALSWAAKNPRLVTSEWVLLEIADGLCSERGRTLAVQLIDSVKANKRVRVVPLSS